MNRFLLIAFILLWTAPAFAQGTTPTFQVKTIADLVATPIPTISNRLTALVTGRVTANDGGGGVFFYESSSALTTNLGTVFKPSSTTGRWLRQYSGALNVKWFGALGDGVTSDSAAIQDVINAAGTSYIQFNPIQIGPRTGSSATNGAVQVYFPPGKFILSSTITVPSGITIEGDGPDSQISVVSGASYFGPFFDLAYTDPDGNPGARRNMKVTFRNIGLDGNDMAPSIGVRGIDSFSGKGVYDFLVDNCQIIRFATYGIWLNSPIKAVIQNSAFEYNNGVSIRLDLDTSGNAINTVTGCKFYAGGTAIESFVGAMSDFSNNEIEGNGYVGILMHGEIGSTIRDNYFESNGTTATNIGHNIYLEPSQMNRVFFQTGAASLTTLTDTNANFLTTGTRPMGVRVGDLVRNLTWGSLYTVSSVLSATQLSVTLTTSGQTDGFYPGQPYSIQAMVGSATSTVANKLVDSAANFVAGVADLGTDSVVFDKTNGSMWNVTAVDSATQLSVTLRTAGDGGATTITSGDSYILGWPSRDVKIVNNNHAGQTGNYQAILLGGDDGTLVLGDSVGNAQSDILKILNGCSLRSLLFDILGNLTVSNDNTVSTNLFYRGNFGLTNSFSAVNLASSDITGVLPVANGGSSSSTFTKGIVESPGGTSALITQAGSNGQFMYWTNGYPSNGSIMTNGNTYITLTSANTTPDGGQFFCITSDSLAINKGGSIALGGVYTGTTTTTFAGIAGRKENATDGNYAGYLQFNTSTHGPGGSEKARLTSTGKFGIGMTPTTQLELSTDSAQKPTSALWTITSDVRAKDNIKPYSKGLAELIQINTHEFTFNGFGNTQAGSRGVGIVADEIEQIIPETVSINHIPAIQAQPSTVKKDGSVIDAVESKPAQDVKVFNGHELIFGVMLNAIKELAVKNSILEERILALEKK